MKLVYILCREVVLQLCDVQKTVVMSELSYMTGVTLSNVALLTFQSLPQRHTVCFSSIVAQLCLEIHMTGRIFKLICTYFLMGCHFVIRHGIVFITLLVGPIIITIYLFIFYLF